MTQDSGNWLEDNGIDVIYFTCIVGIEEYDVADVEGDEDSEERMIYRALRILSIVVMIAAIAVRTHGINVQNDFL